MVTSSGQYYSKNTTIGSTYALMGVVTVDGTNVNLKWGSTWGLVTRNAVFDYLDSTTTYVSRSTTIPRKADGKVDVTALNLSVMKYAPLRGCLVMFDMSSNVVLYTMMDGEQKQFAGSQSGSVASALALRTATDPNSLPLTSKMTALPVFTQGPATTGGVGAGSWTKDTATQPDRTRAWLTLFVGIRDASPYPGRIVNSTDVTVPRNNTGTYAIMVTGDNPPMYFGLGTGWTISREDTFYFMSGWARAGSPYQIVGYASAGYLAVSSYGLTSVSPVAVVSSVSTYMLTSSNVQAEILSRMPAGTTSSASMGFMYDASVGSYGQVTWLSQL